MRRTMALIAGALLCLAGAAGDQSHADGLQVAIAVPAAGAIVRDTPEVTVVASPVASAPAAVEVRLRADDRSVAVVLDDPNDSADERGWTGKISAAGLPNGPADIAFRTAEAAGGEWTGHDIVLDLDPPAPQVGAAVDGGDVVLTWAGLDVPDLTGFRVERADAAGEFTEVADLDAAATSWRDPAPDPGAYRYRVSASRPGGSGEPRSAATVVDVTVEAPEPAPDEGDEGGEGEGDTGEGEGDTGEGEGDTGEGGEGEGGEGEGGSEEGGGEDEGGEDEGGEGEGGEGEGGEDEGGEGEGGEDEGGEDEGGEDEGGEDEGGKDEGGKDEGGSGETQAKGEATNEGTTAGKTPGSGGPEPGGGPQPPSEPSRIVRSAGSATPLVPERPADDAEVALGAPPRLTAAPRVISALLEVPAPLVAAAESRPMADPFADVAAPEVAGPEQTDLVPASAQTFPARERAGAMAVSATPGLDDLRVTLLAMVALVLFGWRRRRIARP